MGVYKYLNVGRDVQELDSGKKNYVFTWICTCE